VFPAQNFFADIPVVKPVTNSIISGISNALLTLRIGIITRKYLFDEGQFSKSQTRVAAIKEAIVLMPRVIKDVMDYFPSKIAPAFSKIAAAFARKPSFEDGGPVSDTVRPQTGMGTLAAP
jgi:hypothetical protein